MTQQLENMIVPDTAPIEHCRSKIVGGKGRNLTLLQSAGLPVPHWCVVTTSLFDGVMEHLRERLDTLIAGIDFTHREAIEEGSRAIAELIQTVPIPPEFQQELHQRMAHFNSDASLVVRSSIVDEDSADHSFAGQMDSFLNVPANRVMPAVRAVWCSAFSARALLYRHRKGLPLTTVSAAVIVQEMIDGVASGVMFTRDPSDGSSTCTISAAFGLGDGVTSDMAEADTYKIAPRNPGDPGDPGAPGTTASVRQVVAKSQQVVASKDATGGTQVASLTPEQGAAPVLTDRHIRELRDIGQRIEQVMGEAQDVEWVQDRKGKFWIVQARPIVFRHTAKTTTKPSRVWDNSNIVESYPGITLPLTFSFARKAYAAAFEKTIDTLAPTQSKNLKRQGVFDHLLGRLNGRVYYNLLNWYAMLAPLPGFKRRKAAWDEMIGITDSDPYEATRLTLTQRISATVRLAWAITGTRRHAQRFFAGFTPTYERLRRIDLERADLDELTQLFDDVQHELVPIWRLTLLNDLCAMTWYAWLERLCKQWLPEKSNVVNELIQQCGQVDSVAPVRALNELASQIKANTELMGSAESDDHQILQRIRNEPRYARLNQTLEDYLDRFGDRCFEDLKLESPSYHERPDLLIGIARRLAQRTTSRPRHTDTAQARRDDPIDHLRHPIKRFILRHIASRARAAIANRENMRLARSRTFGLARRFFLRMGQLLVEQDSLDTVEDIFYLTVDEVFDFVRGTATTQNLQSLVALRRAETIEFSEDEPADRIETTGAPYPIPTQPVTDDARETNRAKGTGCSGGCVTGRAAVVNDPHRANVDSSQILVARSTDPAWALLMAEVQGVVVERGSVLSHTAIIGRELGIPIVVGVRDATQRITDGCTVTIDGNTGEVRWR
jgi:pyruvate,water dikinase